MTTVDSLTHKFIQQSSEPDWFILSRRIDTIITTINGLHNKERNSEQKWHYESYVGRLNALNKFLNSDSTNLNELEKNNVLLFIDLLKRLATHDDALRQRLSTVLSV